VERHRKKKHDRPETLFHEDTLPLLFKRKISLSRRNPDCRALPCSVGKEVENIAKHAAVSFEYFGVLAPGAGYRAELEVLNVENFAQNPAGCANFAGLIAAVPAFGALVIKVLHLSSFV
jgi:hypothetical protein